MTGVQAGAVAQLTVSPMPLRVNANTTNMNTLAQRSEHLAALRTATESRLTSGHRLERAADSEAARRLTEPPKPSEGGALLSATGADRFRAVMALGDTAAKSSLETDFGVESARISARQVYQDADRSSTRSRLL